MGQNGYGGEPTDLGAPGATGVQADAAPRVRPGWPGPAGGHFLETALVADGRWLDDGLGEEQLLPPFGRPWDTGPHMGRSVAILDAAAPAGIGLQAPVPHVPAHSRARAPPRGSGAGLGSTPEGAPSASVPDTPGDPGPGPEGPDVPAPAGAAAGLNVSSQTFFWAVHNHTRSHHGALRSQMSDFEDWLERMSIFFEPAGALP